MNVKQWMVGAALLLASGVSCARGAEAVGAGERERKTPLLEWLAEYSQTLELKSLSTYLLPAPSNSGLKAGDETQVPDAPAPRRQELDRTFPMW